MGLIEEISEYLQKGRAKNVKALVQQALDENLDPKEILNEGLLSGMMIIGAKFKNNEVFVPEVLVAARAMNAGLTVLEPKTERTIAAIIVVTFESMIVQNALPNPRFTTS